MPYVSPTPTSKNEAQAVHSRTICVLLAALPSVELLSRLNPPRIGLCSVWLEEKALDSLEAWSEEDMEAGQITDIGGPTAGSSSARGGSSKESSDLPGEPGVVEESVFVAACPDSAKGLSDLNVATARPGCRTGAVVVAGEGGP